MSTLTEETDELQRTWHEHIPISKAMAIEVASYDASLLTLSAALAPNVNVHGTAFAGSLYAVSALCGWGSVWLQMKQCGFDTSVVIAEGSIKYFKPVQHTIQARCLFDADDQKDALGVLQKDGKCRFLLVVDTFRDDVLQARFKGSFAVLQTCPDIHSVCSI